MVFVLPSSNQRVAAKLRKVSVEGVLSVYKLTQCLSLMSLLKIAKKRYLVYKYFAIMYIYNTVVCRGLDLFAARRHRRRCEHFKFNHVRACVCANDAYCIV